MCPLFLTPLLLPLSAAERGRGLGVRVRSARIHPEAQLPIVLKPAFVLLHAPSVYDFRQRSILFGPVSDVVPSSPVFEMYPIGFTSIAEYLQRHGYRTRIVNLALRMLEDPCYDVPAV